MLIVNRLFNVTDNMRLKEISIMNSFEQIQENTISGSAVAFIPNLLSVQKLLDIMDDHGLEQIHVIPFPTCDKNTLDLILTSLTSQFQEIHSPDKYQNKEKPVKRQTDRNLDLILICIFIEYLGTKFRRSWPLLVCIHAFIWDEAGPEK